MDSYYIYDWGYASMELERSKRVWPVPILLCVLMLTTVAVYAGQKAPEGLEMPDKLPKLKGPIVATTCGQSPGAMMVRMLCKQAGVACDQEDMITAGELQQACKNKDTAYKVLIVTMGTSLKGMGAAGVDVDSEVDRCNALIAAARKLGLFVIAAQIEGADRRTDETDEQSNKCASTQSDLIVIRKEINWDNYFTNVAKEKKIPIIMIKQAIDFEYVLRVLFSLPPK